MAYGLYLASDYGSMSDPLPVMDGVTLSSAVQHGDILLNAAGTPTAVVLGSFQSGGAEPWVVHGVRMYIAVGLASTRSGSWGTAMYATAKRIGWSGPYLAASATANDSSGDYISPLTLETNIDRTLPNDTEGSYAMTSYLGETTQLVRTVRSFDIEGLPMSMPRPSIAVRIAQWGTRIDAMDPTAEANASKKMSTYGFGSQYPQMLCAARYDNTYIFTIRDMNRLRQGNVYSSSTSLGLCPAAELVLP